MVQRHDYHYKAPCYINTVYSLHLSQHLKFAQNFVTCCTSCFSFFTPIEIWIKIKRSSFEKTIDYFFRRSSIILIESEMHFSQTISNRLLSFAYRCPSSVFKSHFINSMQSVLPLISLNFLLNFCIIA